MMRIGLINMEIEEGTKKSYLLPLPSSWRHSAVISPLHLPSQHRKMNAPFGFVCLVVSRLAVVLRTRP